MATEDPVVTHEEKAKARQLEAELFGGAEDFVDHLEHSEEDDAGAGAGQPSYIRNVSAVDGLGELEPGQKQQQGVPTQTSKGQHGKRKPAWVDGEDAGHEVDIAAVPRLRKLRKAHGEAVVTGNEFEKRLRGQHKKLHPGTDWADVAKRHTDTDEVDESLLETAAYTQGLADLTGNSAEGAKLPAGNVELTRVQDANIHQRHKAVVQCVEFHPNAQLLMSAAFDKRLTFVQADGVRNSVVQSVFLEDMPIHTAHFAAGGSQVIASGRRKFFYVMDLETQRLERVKGVQGREERSLEAFAVPPAATCARQQSCIAFLGNEGCVPLVSLQSRQWVGELKMNGTVRSAAFSADGLQLYTGGGDGLVYVWDVRMRRCLLRHRDEGCVNSTALAVAPSGGVFAAGSDSGVVNVYRTASERAGVSQTGRPAAPVAAGPLRELTNLVTSVDTLAFSPDSQMMCMASRLKKDSLRLVHMPTLTTFSNWPTGRSPLHYVHCACFSPGGGFLAIGNAKGHVLLYRLHHYTQI